MHTDGRTYHINSMSTTIIMAALLCVECLCLCLVAQCSSSPTYCIII